jgi:hypothetical protein
MRSSVLVGCLGLGVPLAGCFASVTSVARDMFTTTYGCPSDQVVVQPAGTDDSFTEVIGCGHREEYNCVAGYQSRHGERPTSCTYRSRAAYGATDGTVHETVWESTADPQRAAAIASAAHDLPCPSASIAVIDSLTLEGCGQRITYRQLEQGYTTPPGHYRITGGYRYILVGRIPIPAP